SVCEGDSKVRLVLLIYICHQTRPYGRSSSNSYLHTRCSACGYSTTRTAPLPDRSRAIRQHAFTALPSRLRSQSTQKLLAQAGDNFFLAGEESMKMTHWMRTMHDGIFIGVGTAVNDNLQLNGARPVIVSTCITIHPINRSISAVRLLPFPAQNTHFQYYHHPRPIVLDASSAAFTTITNAAKGVGVSPWVISAPPPKIEGFFASEDDGEKLQRWEARRDVLQAAWCHRDPRRAETIHPDLPPATSSLPLRTVLRSLREKGICSVMVEGGDRLIQSFLSECLVDALIVTTSPVLVDRDGV
ncbi:hypothetical protein F5148DRAFT_885428, partial [Russula earlei]